MKPYFVGHTIPTLLFVCTMVAWAAIEIPQAFKRRPEATSADRGSVMIVRLCAVAAIVVAGLVVTRVPAASVAEGVATFAIAVGVMWAGIGLRWWSFRTLGRYFTFTVMTSNDQHVVSTGPYRFVRHPSYLAILLTLAGIGAMHGNWLSLAALVFVPLIGLVYRIRVEEAALSASLGDAYMSYASRRKRLLPFVW